MFWFSCLILVFLLALHGPCIPKPFFLLIHNVNSLPLCFSLPPSLSARQPLELNILKPNLQAPKPSTLKFLPNRHFAMICPLLSKRSSSLPLIMALQMAPRTSARKVEQNFEIEAKAKSRHKLLKQQFKQCYKNWNLSLLKPSRASGLSSDSGLHHPPRTD